jgi:hypothetical protein
MSTQPRTWLVWSVLGLLPGTVAQAAPIVAGQDLVPSVAVQSVVLFPGTPFNPGPTPLTVELTATGSFVLDRALQSGSTINFTLPVAHFFGTLPGPLPPLTFDLAAGTPGLNASSGAITNVLQNSADPGFATGDPSSFASGDFTANTFFELVLANGATIYSDPNSAAVFTAALTALPPSPGTVFASPAPVNLYLQTGPGFDPTRDPVIGQSFDRTVTAVPEPPTLALCLTGAVVLGTWRWRDRQGKMRRAPSQT